MKFNRLYIIDESKPFNGSVENTMTCLPEFGTPEYVDYMEKPTTFEEYKKLNPEKKLKILTREDVEKYLDKHRNDIQGPWEEITEDEYYNLLECLPPKKWRDIGENISVFAVGECYTMDLYTHCIFDRSKNKYYKALRPIGSTDERLLNSYLGMISH